MKSALLSHPLSINRVNLNQEKAGTGTIPNVQSNCEIGTVQAGKTNYYIVPAKVYYLIYTNGNINNITMGSLYKNESNTFYAGHIYNITF